MFDSMIQIYLTYLTFFLLNYISDTNCMSNYLGNEILEALEAKTSSLSSSCQRVLGISSSRRRLEEEDDEEDDDVSSSGQLFELDADWSDPNSFMSKQDQILALEIAIDEDQDKMQQSLDNLTMAMAQVLEKLDIDQANKKKKPKAPKKPKHAKASETQEEEAREEEAEDTDLFKRNLLAVEEVVNDKFDDMKSQVKLVESKVESMESKVESMEGKVESMESKIESIEGKVDRMEKSIDDIKDMLSQLLTGGVVE